MENSVILSVGDTHHLRLGKDRIVYAGMPSEEVYSIVQMKWEFVYRGYSWNLFFPREQNRIRIDGMNIVVESVTSDQISVRRQTL
jgi:hypothetical protein